MGKEKRFFMMVIIFAILFFVYKFYLEFAENEKDKAVIAAEQQKIDDAEFKKTLEGKKHKKWEVIANRTLDPLNFLGFR